MRQFWHGFENNKSAHVQFKKHVLVLFWSPDSGPSEAVKRLSFKYPSVKIKMVNVKKEPLRPQKLGVDSFPTVVLLKEGREIERLSNPEGSALLLEHLFRKASV